MQVPLAVRKQVKRLKKIIERDEVFYPYQHNGKTYYMVRFTRFGQGAGNVILTSEGEVVPRTEAVPVYEQYIEYNTRIIDTVSKISREKDTPVDRFKQTHELLTHIVTPIVDDLPYSSVGEDIASIITMANTFIKGRDEVRAIYDQISQIDAMVQKTRGYLTEQEVEKVVNLVMKWSLINYDSLRKAREALAPCDRLRQFCRTHHEQMEARRSGSARSLDQLLRGFTDRGNQKVLFESLREAERDEQGNPTTFSPGEKGLREFAEMRYRISNYTFEKNVLPLLRNP